MMNFLDIVLICIVAIFLIRGLFRGLVQEILSLTAIVLAIYLSSNFHQVLVPHLKMYINGEATVNGLSYVLIFFGTLFVFWILAKLIRSVLDIALLGWVDRGAGAIFGAIEGTLISLILLMFIQGFAPEAETLKESYLAPRSQHLIELVGNLTPDSMRSVLRSNGIDLPSASDVLDSTKEAIGLDDQDEAQQ